MTLRVEAKGEQTISDRKREPMNLEHGRVTYCMACQEIEPDHLEDCVIKVGDEMYGRHEHDWKIRTERVGLECGCGEVVLDGARLIDVDVLRQAIYAISVRHNWAEIVDTDDRTEEIAAEYRTLMAV